MDGGTLGSVVGAVVPSGVVLAALAYMLRRRSEGIDERLDLIEANAQVREEKLDKSLSRIHDRIDVVTKDQAELSGYVRGLQNGGPK